MDDNDGILSAKGNMQMKKLQAVRFMRQPFIVTGYKVTKENMETLSRWCRGHIVQPDTDDEEPFIRVPVDRPTKAWQTEASVGTWIILSHIRGEESFKVYTEEWLRKNFFEIPRESDSEEFVRAPIIAPEEPAIDIVNNHDRIGSNVLALPVQGGNRVAVDFQAPR